MPVADEAERAQRLVDEDRVAQGEVGRLETRASGGLVRAHPDEAVPRGGALDEVVQRLRDAGQRDSARNSRIESAVSPSVMPAPSDSVLNRYVDACARDSRCRDRAQAQIEGGRERTGGDRGQVGLQVHAIDLGGQVRRQAARCRARRRPRSVSVHSRLGADRGDQAPGFGDAAQPGGAFGPLGVEGVGARPARERPEAAVVGAQTRRQRRCAAPPR